MKGEILDMRECEPFLEGEHIMKDRRHLNTCIIIDPAAPYRRIKYVPCTCTLCTEQRPQTGHANWSGVWAGVRRSRKRRALMFHYRLRLHLFSIFFQRQTSSTTSLASMTLTSVPNPFIRPRFLVSKAYLKPLTMLFGNITMDYFVMQHPTSQACPNSLAATYQDSVHK